MSNLPMSNHRRFSELSDETRRALLDADREDLLMALTLRFGSVPESVQRLIAACHNGATLERWILVAANVPDWEAFLRDLDAGPNAFKMVGVDYEPNLGDPGSARAPASTFASTSERAPAPEASDEARDEARKED